MRVRSIRVLLYFIYHNTKWHLPVLAVTAANATHSSYACYLDKKRHTFLGDVFSVKWMENSDKVSSLCFPVESLTALLSHLPAEFMKPVVSVTFFNKNCLIRQEIAAHLIVKLSPLKHI